MLRRLHAAAMAILFAVAALSFATVLPITPAYAAAAGDPCMVVDQPGTLVNNDNGTPGDPSDDTLVCTAVGSPSNGMTCGVTDTYYSSSAGQCVVNGASCSVTSGSETKSGSYTLGTCAVGADEPVTPSTPTGFTGVSGAGAAPSGDQQTMCVNASPFIGGGVFVVSGTVLCYTGAGKMMDMYAYTDSDSGLGGGWNPFNPSAWNSLTLRDLYAKDDITALGSLSVYEGAQIYSANGKNGLEVTDNGVLVRSADDNGNTSALEITPDLMTMMSTHNNGTAVDYASGLQIEPDKLSITSGYDADGDTNLDEYASLLLDARNGAKLDSTYNGTGDQAAVTIRGTLGANGESRMGVEITGSGEGSNGTVDGKGEADWADVVVHSANYGKIDGLGTAMIVNDYGVNIKAPELNGTGRSYNEFVSGAHNDAGSILTNNFGEGGGGIVNNLVGSVGTPGSVVYNAIGTDPTSKGGSSVNTIGNTNTLTEIRGTAGTTTMVMIQGALDMGSEEGASVLASPTHVVNGGTSVIQKNGTGRHVVLDENGRMSIVDGTATEATTSTYLTNGYGNTNGLAITESGATLSGGEKAGTNLQLTDSGAHFANNLNGGPVRVSGVADGQGPFEAANIRQLDSGLASVAALAGLPAPQVGKKNSFGFGFGMHDSGKAISVGGQSLFGDNLSVKYGLAVSESSGLVDGTASLGMGWSW